MADNSTDVNTNAQVNLKDNVSAEAKKIQSSFEAIGKAAEESAKKISTLEDALLLIETKRRAGALSDEKAEKQSAKLQTAIKNETETSKKHADALNKEADALNKRAQAYEKNVKYRTSKAGIAERNTIRTQNAQFNSDKNERLTTRMENASEERQLSREKLELRKERLKFQKSQSRYGVGSQIANAVNEIGGKIRDRGLVGRVTSDISSVVTAGILGGPAGIVSTAISKIITGFTDFRDSVMEAYGSLEKIKTQMSVVFGGQVQSNSQFNNITEYATKSPFGIEGMAEYATLLKQSGIYSSELLDTLKMIGDTAGGDADRMKRIANNYAQIVAVGKASMLDMRQFAYAGIPIYKEVADYLKVSQAELRKMISDGKVDAETIEAVFKRMTEKGGVFFQATQKGATTLQARKQNLEDIATLAKGQIGEWWMNLGDKDTTGSYETSLLDVQENFYEALSKWGDRTNLVNNVKKLSEGSRQLDVLKQDRIRIQNDKTLDQVTKTQLLAYIDAQIAKYSNVDADNKISTYGRSQMLAEQQQANLWEIDGLEEKRRNAKANLAKNLKTALDAGIIEKDSVLSEISTELTFNNTARTSKKSIEKWRKHFAGSSEYLEAIRDSLNELGFVEEEFEKINSVNGEDRFKNGPKISAFLDFYPLMLSGLLSGNFNFAHKWGIFQNNLFPASTGTQIAPNSFETMFAAGSMYAMNGQNSIEESIDKAKKGKSGSQTAASYFKQLYDATPEGQAKIAEEERQQWEKIKNEGIEYQKLIKSFTLESGGLDKEVFREIPLEKLVRLETNYSDENSQTYSGNAYDYLTDLTAKGEFKEDQKNRYLELRDNMSLLSGAVLNDESLTNKDVRSAVETLNSLSSIGLTGADNDVRQNMAEVFDANRKAEDAIAKELENPNISSEEKTYYEKILILLRSAFKQQKFNADDVANIDLSLLDKESKGKKETTKSMDLEPLWKRIIASGTGLNVDLMNYNKPSEVLDNQWQEQLSRNLVSSIVTSIRKSGFQDSTKSHELGDAYSFFAYKEMKTLGASSKGGNLNDVKNENSEKAISSNSIPTQVNALGTPYTVAQVDWKQTETNFLEALKNGVLNSATIEIFQTAYENQITAAMNLLDKALTTAENGEYVVDKKFDEAAVNAFSGLDIKDGSTLEAEIKNAEGVFKKETLTWDSAAKKWKRANGEYVESITEVRYSLDNLSKWINEFVKTTGTKRDTASNQNSFQKRYNEIQTKTNTPAQKALTEELSRRYLQENPNVSPVEYSYVRDYIGEQVQKQYPVEDDGSGIKINRATSALGDFRTNTEMREKMYNDMVTTPLYGKINNDNTNLATEYNNSVEIGRRLNNDTNITSYMNERLMNNKGKQPNFAKQLFNEAFGITGNNSYKDQKIVDALGDDFAGQDWADLKSGFGRMSIENIQNLRGDESAWEQANMNPFSENFSQEKTLFENLKNSYPELYEQAEGEGAEKDNNFLSGLADNTSVLDEVGDKFGKLNSLTTTWKSTISEIGSGFAKIGMQFATSSIVEMSETIGENFGNWGDIMDSGADKMRELGKAALSNLSSLFVQAGLAYIANNPNWAGLGVGLAMIAAGGMAGAISGMMSDSNDDDDDDQTAKLKQIKSDLADLLEQARNDATYYENELRHQNALSTNNSISQTTKRSSVHDALISSNGNIITTDPKDYLIATKHPEELVGGGGTFKPNIVFNVKNNSSVPVSSSYAAKEDENGNIEITALIEEITSNFIASSKSDDVFNARQARLQGRDVVA